MEILLLSAIALTVGTGFFVASEFSLVNLDRVELESRSQRGEKGLSNSIRALKRTATHLSSAQLGITLTTLLTGYLAEPALSELIKPALISLSVSQQAVGSVAWGLSILIVTTFSFLIGELVPKQLALAIPLKTNKVVVGFQLVFTWVFSWMVQFMNRSGNVVVRLFGIEPKEELSFTRSAEELASLVKHSAKEGALDSETANLLTKTLSLSELVAADIMTPRTRMHFVDREQTAKDVVELAIKTGHSRFPVIEDSSDDVIGVVHLKKAAAVPREKRAEVPATALMTDALRVPETMGLESLMVELRAKGLQLAIVVDEYGGTAGLATLEDLVEELVGDLVDEHDRARAGITLGANSSLLFPGMMRPDELAEMSIPIPQDGDYETVAGFIMSRLGRIPQTGDEVELSVGFLRVERMDQRRVDRVRFTPKAVTDVE
ncbi:MAG: hemolysin family protein [Actinomycetota bacterium]